MPEDIFRHFELSVYPDKVLKDTNTGESQQRKMRQILNSPFLPLPLIAFQVWSDLLGEPLVLSELGLGITCSPLCGTERGKKMTKIYNYRNKQQAGTRLSNTTCGCLRGDEDTTLRLPSSLEAPLVIIFSPEVLIQRRF